MSLSRLFQNILLSVFVRHSIPHCVLFYWLPQSFCTDSVTISATPPSLQTQLHSHALLFQRLPHTSSCFTGNGHHHSATPFWIFRSIASPCHCHLSALIGSAPSPSSTPHSLHHASYEQQLNPMCEEGTLKPLMFVSLIFYNIQKHGVGWKNCEEKRG